MHARPVSYGTRRSRHRGRTTDCTDYTQISTDESWKFAEVHENWWDLWFLHDCFLLSTVPWSISEDNSGMKENRSCRFPVSLRMLSTANSQSTRTAITAVSSFFHYPTLMRPLTNVHIVESYQHCSDYRPLVTNTSSRTDVGIGQKLSRCNLGQVVFHYSQ